ncbi:MAG TPA: GNAT family N-acetyltransferase [Bauldia sp.]|nr:GNAT family N-acetyltransferase [Bauldia sp.]
MDAEIKDNPVRHRYELQVDGQVAYLRYRRMPGVLTLVHTEVPKPLEGKGIGARLVRHVLDLARSEGMKVVPLCPFVVAWMKRHPEYDDMRVPAEEPGLRA